MLSVFLRNTCRDRSVIVEIQLALLCKAKILVLQGRIELPTSSLPMTRSTTELLQHTVNGGVLADISAFASVN
jgi:hypothetical protein